MNRLVINADLGTETINKNIYGHFAEHLGRCVYEGFWVGEDSSIANIRGIRQDVVQALRKLNPPVLRWPGGCFADEYHWMDGIGPRQSRPSMINTHWGGVTENNHFGTHEFFDLCEMLGAEPYICGNVGSGTVREMQQWVEYITFPGKSPMADLRRKSGREEPWELPYFGVGNESWGCGGRMRAEYYADEYRRYSLYVRNFGESPIQRIACGANRTDYHWTEVLMREAGRFMDGLSLHYYTTSRPMRGSATQFREDKWFDTLRRALYVEEIIVRHSAIMDRYDPERSVDLIVDEWGTWYDVEPGTNPGFLYQQNTLRDALVAGVHLNIFNNHCQRVRMANIAQTVNVLQAMVLTDKEKMIVTPTYHVFEMYKDHQGATLLPIALESAYYEYEGQSIPALSVSASLNQEDALTITLCNLDPNRNAAISCELRGFAPGTVTGRVITADAMNAHNTFDAPETVSPVPFEGVSLSKEGFSTTLPSKSVVLLQVWPPGNGRTV